MHPSAHIVLSGIEACRSYLRQHPGQPLKAINRRFDYADTAQRPFAHTADHPGELRWVELRPHSAGIAIQVVDGPRSALAVCVLYPTAAEPGNDEGAPCGSPRDGLWLGIDPGAITAPPFLTKLAAAAARALEQLDSYSFPEALHG